MVGNWWWNINFSVYPSFRPICRMGMLDMILGWVESDLIDHAMVIDHTQWSINPLQGIDAMSSLRTYVVATPNIQSITQIHQSLILLPKLAPFWTPGQSKLDASQWFQPHWASFQPTGILLDTPPISHHPNLPKVKIKIVYCILNWWFLLKTPRDDDSWFVSDWCFGFFLDTTVVIRNPCSKGMETSRAI